VTNQKQHIQF